VNRMILKILVLAAVSMFLIGSVAMAQCPGTTAKKEAAATNTAVKANAEGDMVMLNVSNMTCGACVNQVTKALAGVEGVNDVSVNLEKGTAEVYYSSAKVKPEVLTAAVVKAGYPAEVSKANVTTTEKSKHDCAATCGSKTAKKGCDPTACGMKTAKKDDDSQ